MTTLLFGVVSFSASEPPRKIAERSGQAMSWPGSELAIVEPVSAALGHAGRTGVAAPTELVADIDGAWWTSDHPLAGQRVTHATLSAALREDADGTPSHIDGEYAYAWWQPENQTLLLCRDGVGVRPLYYDHEPGAHVYFASLIQGVLAAAPQRYGVDRNTLAKLTTGNYNLGDRTQFEGIARVMPGECLRITPDGIARKRHWRLECRNPIPPTADRATVMGELRDKLDQAVRRRIPSEGTVYSHFSGGLDSTAVAALAALAIRDQGREVMGYAFTTRPLPPEIPVIDEMSSINATLEEHPNIALKMIYPTPDEMLGRGRVSAFCPVYTDADDLYEQIMRHAASEGATLILNGLGGDEVVSYAGSGGFAELLLRGRWRALWQMTRAIQRRTGRPAWRTILSEVKRYVLPHALPFRSRQSLGRSKRQIEALGRLMRPAYRDAAYSDDSVGRPDSAWMRATRMGFGHVVWVQETVAHIAGCHGLRCSSPLLDRELMEFSIRLPPEFLHVDGLMRAGLREPMAGILPDETRIRRTKLHYDPAAAHIFGRDIEKVRARIDALRGTPADEVFDVDAMQAVIADVPEPDEILSRIAEAAAEGEQYFLPETQIAEPLILAEFLNTAEGRLKDVA